MEITMKSLIGEHVLSGAFFDSIREPQYDGCDEMEEKTVLRFTLNGTHYQAVEDPNDGFRSSLDRVETTDIAPENPFHGVSVIAEQKPQSTEEFAGEDEIIGSRTQRRVPS